MVSLPNHATGRCFLSPLGLTSWTLQYLAYGAGSLSEDPAGTGNYAFHSETKWNKP
ncbi:MAG: hypothetical protein JWQ85_1782 [Mucilaginibacter sp.]|nr:hypothetical protein [Mucilaginibacter sp.]